jgi:hypothetical protein
MFMHEILDYHAALRPKHLRHGKLSETTKRLSIETEDVSELPKRESVTRLNHNEHGPRPGQTLDSTSRVVLGLQTLQFFTCNNFKQGELRNENDNTNQRRRL